MCALMLDEPTGWGTRQALSPSKEDTVAGIAVGDADLLALAQGGDAAAFAALYRRYAPRIYDYAARRLGDLAAAEDATQIVFMRMATSLAGCRDPNAFAGWLFAIARNVVADVGRGQQRSGAPLGEVPDAEDPAPSPEEWAIQRERGEELQALRERCLTERERELFDLLLTDLNDKEIAGALGRRHGAVRTAHWRLLIKLRDCLGIRVPEKEGRHVAP
jgi:RNA polymerase sigma-70 factor (ECF subfamily)